MVSNYNSLILGAIVSVSCNNPIDKIGKKIISEKYQLAENIYHSEFEHHSETYNLIFYDYTIRGEEWGDRRYDSHDCLVIEKDKELLCEFVVDYGLMVGKPDYCNELFNQSLSGLK